MWFKNLQLYHLQQSFDLNPEELHEKLEPQSARECGSMEPSTYGWERPLGRQGTLLTHGANGHIMLCARSEEKILPATVIREKLAQKVEEIEQAEARKVRRREKEELKDILIQQLLPQAFTKSSLTYAYIDPKGRWLVVDASSAKKAEELINLLRDSLGSLKVKPVIAAQSPAAVMTSWLADQAPQDGFVVADECELRDPMDEGGIIRCRRQDLMGDEIAPHLKAGKQVVRLALEWAERITFVLCEDLSIKRLGFMDMIQEEAAEVAAEDDSARFDADFAIMSLELGRFMPALLKQFGGMEKD
jgi:recombination associated protein RdgC